MIRWAPTTPPPVPRRWQSRAEILKAHLDSLGPLELLRVRPDYYAMTYGWDFKNRRYAQGRLARYEELDEKAGFNLNQPRVPAGNPNGGQWESGTVSGAPTNNPLVTFAAASRRGRSVAYCLAQYTIDNLQCNSVEPASRRAVCRGQATERFSACLVGRPIPPLSY